MYAEHDADLGAMAAAPGVCSTPAGWPRPAGTPLPALRPELRDAFELVRRVRKYLIICALSYNPPYKPPYK